MYTGDTASGKAPAMARKIGDDYFDRMFPDQTAPKPEPRQPSRADRFLDRLLSKLPETTEDTQEYEYKTVRVPGAKASRSRHENALNALAQEGWELVQVQPRGVLQFGTKDTVTLRRKR
jgi:hypothetical protein